MRHLGTQVLETPRLLLRPFTLDDAPCMFRNWANDSEVTRYLTWVPHSTLSVTQEYLESVVASYQTPETYHWAIVLKELNQPIGSIGVVRRNDDIDEVHIGYCIGKAWWHTGLMSEALDALVHFFMEEVGVNRFSSRHDPRNPNSGKVMTHCGLIYEGTLRQSDRNNQGVCDGMWYSLLRKDYQKGKDVL